MRTRSSIKLLFIAAGVVALVLALAPASFAGEDDPGPTQVGEVQAAPIQAPAAAQGPASVTHATLGASTTLGVSSKKDTVRAVGGIQTGAGGMAVTEWSPTLALALAGGGVVLLLAAGIGGAPLRRGAAG
jgi:hypothetical protein